MNKIEKIISGIGRNFNADERETSILFDHGIDRVFLETTNPYTARRWYEMFKEDERVSFDDRADNLKMSVPVDYCRKPELVIKAKYRIEQEQPGS